jgi:hypothetical protein
MTLLSAQFIALLQLQGASKIYAQSSFSSSEIAISLYKIEEIYGPEEYYVTLWCNTRDNII